MRLLINFNRAAEPLQNVATNSRSINESEGTGTPLNPESPLVEKVPETLEMARPIPPQEDLQSDQKQTHSVLQQKLTNLVFWMGKLGIVLAALAVLTLIVRFIIDHVVLTDKQIHWDWCYLEYFIKFIVIGIVLL